MIPLFKVHMPKEVMAPLQETMLSGFIGEGPKVKDFESSLSEYIGNPYTLTTNSCTSAIQLALRLSGVGYGDEVISTAMTCTATNEPILAAGAKIIWADINRQTGNISPTEIEAKISPKTKAIIVVHWGGDPVDIVAINNIAQRHQIKVIEDAAHAFGADYQQQKVGNHSDFVCFSFQAIKHISTVDGGALFCRDKNDYDRGKLLRWYGIDRESPRSDFRCEADIKEWGYKFHMNDVAATIGIVQMQYIKTIIAHRRAIAQQYNEALKNIAGVTLLTNQVGSQSAYWLYTILVDGKTNFMSHMTENDVMVSQVHARNDLHSMFAEFKCPLPGVDAFVAKSVCIPIGFWVTPEIAERIITAIKKGW